MQDSYFVPGSTITEKTEQLTKFMILGRGLIKKVAKMSSGKEITVGTYKQGDILEFQNLITDSKLDYSLKTVENT